MRLKNFDANEPRKAVTREFEITINANNSDAIYINGEDEIKLDRYATYELVNESTGNHVLEPVEFTIVNKT